MKGGRTGTGGYNEGESEEDKRGRRPYLNIKGPWDDRHNFPRDPLYALKVIHELTVVMGVGKGRRCF